MYFKHSNSIESKISCQFVVLNWCNVFIWDFHSKFVLLIHDLFIDDQESKYF